MLGCNTGWRDTAPVLLELLGAPAMRVLFDRLNGRALCNTAPPLQRPLHTCSMALHESCCNPDLMPWPLQSAGDLPTLLAASRALLGVFSAGPGDEERAGKQQLYVERKAGELAVAVVAAQAAPCHAALLSWRPAAKG